MPRALTRLHLTAVAALLLSGLLVACQGARTIQPQIPTPDPAAGGEIIYDQPLLVTFTGLNEDAAVNGVDTQFRNRLVRVSGAYAPVTPEACGARPSNGPRIHWSLVAENLRLDAVGLEEVLALAPEGTQFTIEGIWRVYEGPLGCGKEPDWGVRFYLEAQRIIEPNPLPFVVAGGGESATPAARPDPDGGPETDIGGVPGTGGGSVDDETPPAEVTPTVGRSTPTATPPGEATRTRRPTPTPQTTATPSPTLTLTNTPPPNTTATPTSEATLTNTPPPGATSTPFVFPTPSPIPQATPPPTNTPGGYPGPTETPSPTPTSAGYP